MNELRKEYHNKTAGQIGEKARDLQTSYFTDEYVFWLEDQLKQLRIGGVGWRSEQLPDFDVQEINEILQDCKEKQEDFTALICRIWNKGYMTAVADERKG